MLEDPERLTQFVHGTAQQTAAQVGQAIQPMAQHMQHMEGRLNSALSFAQSQAVELGKQKILAAGFEEGDYNDIAESVMQRVTGGDPNNPQVYNSDAHLWAFKMERAARGLSEVPVQAATPPTPAPGAGAPTGAQQVVDGKAKRAADFFSRQFGVSYTPAQLADIGSRS